MCTKYAHVRSSGINSVLCAFRNGSWYKSTHQITSYLPWPLAIGMAPPAIQQAIADPYQRGERSKLAVAACMGAWPGPVLDPEWQEGVQEFTSRSTSTPQQFSLCWVASPFFFFLPEQQASLHQQQWIRAATRRVGLPVATLWPGPGPRLSVANGTVRACLSSRATPPQIPVPRQLHSHPISRCQSAGRPPWPLADGHQHYSSKTGRQPTAISTSKTVTDQ